MKVTLIISLLLLAPIALAQTYVLTPGTQGISGYASIVDNNNSHTAIMRTCVISGGTATITSQNLSASIGHTVTISNTGTACDNTFTLLTVTNTLLSTYTFSSAASVNWTAPSYNTMTAVTVDATHYYRYLNVSHSIGFNADQQTMNQQFSSDGVTWGAESVFMADSSTGCNGGPYSYYPASAGVANGLQFVMATKACYYQSPEFVEIDWTRETSPGTWTSLATFSTLENTGIVWQLGGVQQQPIVFPSGDGIHSGYAIILGGCPPGAGQLACLKLGNPQPQFIVVSYDNGVTWGNTGTPGPSLIQIASGSAHVNENAFGCYDSSTNLPCTSSTVSANLLLLMRNDWGFGSNSYCISQDICSPCLYPLLIAVVQSVLGRYLQQT
jgi:hypothetical protein